MKIEVLGPGCPKCSQLAENVQRAVSNTGTSAEVTKVTDIMAITSRGVMMTPALVIDGEVKCSGNVLPVAEIEKLIRG